MGVEYCNASSVINPSLHNSVSSRHPFTDPLLVLCDAYASSRRGCRRQSQPIASALNPVVSFSRPRRALHVARCLLNRHHSRRSMRARSWFFFFSSHAAHLRAEDCAKSLGSVRRRVASRSPLLVQIFYVIGILIFQNKLSAAGRIDIDDVHTSVWLLFRKLQSAAFQIIRCSL